MLLIMAILLGVVAAFIELRTSFSIPLVRRAIEKFSVLGIIFSITLSIFIGAIFGAAGLVVMLGALIATTLTQPVYMVASHVKKTGKDVAKTANEVKQLFMPFFNFFKFALYVMFLPFILVYKVLKWNANRQQATAA